MNRRIDDLASWVLAHFELSQVPPIDIETLAKRMGVLDITYADLIEDGHLEYEPGHTRIRIRHDMGDARSRFTIAHELGHFLLLDPKTRVVVHRTKYNSSNQERLCDEIAAALLLPAEWIAERYASRTHNLSTVRHLAQDTGTSRSAVVARLQQVLSWPEMLLRWRFDKSKWRFVGGAGVPASLHGRIRSAPANFSGVRGLAAG
jgi:Zn-dependent peptidase ImmA (M78 family)